jgi:LPXTG-motif cell wall-anchored protein
MAANETHYFGPCDAEDAAGCYWNAPTMGNGEGTSFISLLDGTHVTIEGCAPGEGLPSVDFDIDGNAWAYCEPALGNDGYVATDQTEEVEMVTQSTEPMTELPATGMAADFTSIGVGFMLLVAGVATLWKARTR